MRERVGPPMHSLCITKALNQMCDVCGKRRGGPGHPDHTKCAKIRQARGWPEEAINGTMVVPQPTQGE
jgi:hypothetical protein